MVRLSINGKNYEVDVEPSTPLLWAIREQAGLTGTKYGCGIAQCGSCTVHMDGAAVRSCTIPASAAVGKRITTIEGLASGKTLHKVQKAWLDHEVPQCGFCQSGMIMAAAALLRQLNEGGSWHVRASLAQTGHWIRGLGRVPGGLALARPDRQPYLETSKSGFGELVAVRHSAQLSRTPALWSRPSVPPGTNPPAWP